MKERIENLLENPLAFNIAKGILLSLAFISVVFTIASGFLALCVNWLWIIGFVFGAIGCGVFCGMFCYLDDKVW